MRLACFQCASPAGNGPAGLALIDRALAAAEAADVALLVMPELLLPGYNADPPADFDTEGALAAVRGMVRRHRVALVFGIAETTAAGLRNAAVALAPDGSELARYAKVQLYGARERRLFVPGERLVAFDWRGRRFGLLVCYDVEFPEHVRALAEAGCDTILVPTANMRPFVGVNLMLVPARAMENAVTIAYANYCGREGDLTYTGRSLIAGPDGPPLACMGEREGLIVADLGTSSLEGAPLSTQRADLRRPAGLVVNGVPR